MASNKEKLLKAIAQGRIIRVVYQEPGKGAKVRTLEPVALGKSTANNPVVRCFQRKGFSVSGENRGWKLFLIRDMRKIKLTNQFYKVRPLYNAQDKSMRLVEAAFDPKTTRFSLRANVGALIDSFVEKLS